MQVMIRWKLRPDEVDRELELLRAVYEELASVQPDGVRYATFQLEDKVTFMSLVDLATGPELLQQLKVFQRYRTNLDDRCDEPPVMTFLHELGAYRFH
ncbi:hypothetical protein I0C86_03660 [Plantactinospora sp. S1510]|uniref:ABM domain-containing protein n=1 Tax=Plantactinospora alkalitolerans TaxID=2789879 RepID=A0ABS0GPH2_9ACTN|nr:hypothetical protein [Plantactinospora alkalitolerans]MBF9128092.1 hypothetical protein [Plantactinospora alkalitolerans]